ncbi:MAG TPA: HPr family phosphocarrier protein [Caldithrix abyssi]|uniref:HPr family phosphocarrier protein n=1 Tax=Caldithrix abyssi TaxID=187145 RepID=A0A7V5VF20_CALAY|nr:HPr family phosphocarrier protein [Caldithrix abyssi]
MIEEVLPILNKHGLHARPAAHLVKTAGQFKSNVKLFKDGLEVNAKSIMGVMMLAAEPGSEVLLQIEGEDEEAAFAALKELFDKKFHEE